MTHMGYCILTLVFLASSRFDDDVAERKLSPEVGATRGESILEMRLPELRKRLFGNAFGLSDINVKEAP